jgi:hypothetical protein
MLNGGKCLCSSAEKTNHEDPNTSRPQSFDYFGNFVSGRVDNANQPNQDQVGSRMIHNFALKFASRGLEREVFRRENFSGKQDDPFPCSRPLILDILHRDKCCSVQRADIAIRVDDPRASFN